MIYFFALGFIAVIIFGVLLYIISQLESDIKHLELEMFKCQCDITGLKSYTDYLKDKDNDRENYLNYIQNKYPEE